MRFVVCLTQCVNVIYLVLFFILVLFLVKMDSDAAVLAGISVACLLLSKVRKRKRKVRSMWMCDYLKGRNNGILNDLELNESFLFKNFTRMSRENFDNLLELVRPKIEKKNTTFRDAVPPEIRLAICLRYLATGDSFASLMYLFKVSKPLISSMMPGVLKAIIEALQDFVKVSVLFTLLHYYNTYFSVLSRLKHKNCCTSPKTLPGCGEFSLELCG